MVIPHLARSPCTARDAADRPRSCRLGRLPGRRLDLRRSPRWLFLSGHLARLAWRRASRLPRPILTLLVLLSVPSFAHAPSARFATLRSHKARVGLGGATGLGLFERAQWPLRKRPPPTPDSRSSPNAPKSGRLPSKKIPPNRWLRQHFRLSSPASSNSWSAIQSDSANPSGRTTSSLDSSTTPSSTAHSKPPGDAAPRSAAPVPNAVTRTIANAAARASARGFPPSASEASTDRVAHRSAFEGAHLIPTA